MIREADGVLEWRGGLAPGHARSGGTLAIAGVSCEELAAQYGTPLLVLDYDLLDGIVAFFRSVCEPHGVEVSYAAKALLVVSLARRLKATPVGLEVCSLGEIVTAERAGFPSDRMQLHGCGKSDEEIGAALDGRVGCIVVDNRDELERLAVRAADRMVKVLLRVNTAIEAPAHASVRTTGTVAKFGFDADDFDSAIARLQQVPALRFAGLHAHVGSQISEAGVFVQNARSLMERAAKLHRAGIACERIVVGGGFGVQMDPLRAADFNLHDTISAVAQAVRGEADRNQIATPRVGIEPGRALIAHCGTSLYRIVAVKRSFGVRFAIVDGSLADNPRPALYGAYHHIVLASREPLHSVETVVCGRSCENDVLGRAMLATDLRAGDTIALCTTGAYTYSMASNYNLFRRPPIAAVSAGRHNLVARRETEDDLLRKDCNA